MWTIITAFLKAIAAFPGIYDRLEKLVNNVQGWMAERRKEKLREAMREGIEEAKESGDTSRIEEGLGRPKK